MATEYRHFFLDTNVVLAIIRGKELADYIDRHYSIRANLFRPLISVVTLGELYTLARRRQWGEKKLQHLDLIEQELVVVDINRRDILQAYAEVCCAVPGKAIGKNDLWIAATTKVTGTTLLTTDKDFLPLSPGQIKLEWIDQNLAKSAQ